MRDAARSPFRPIDERRLDRYFERVLKSRRHEPDLSDSSPPADLFRSSLVSIWDYLGSSRNLRRSDGKPFRLAAGFVDRVTPNAFATMEKDTHLIAIHTGLGSTMLELAMFCCCQSSFFPEVGDSRAELSPTLPEGSALSFMMIDLTSAADTEKLRDFSEMITPRDPQRHLLALLITQMLMRFTWLHEFYHCVNGHVAFVRAAGLASALCEAPDASHPAGAPTWSDLADVALDITEIAHCFELDADRSALWACAKLQLSGAENIAGLDAMPLRQRLKVVLFSAFLVTHFFEEHIKRFGARSSSHPSAYLRLQNLVRIVASHLTEECTDARSVFQEVIAEFDQLAACIPDLFPVRKLLRDINSSIFQADLDKFEYYIDDYVRVIPKSFASYIQRYEY